MGPMRATLVVALTMAVGAKGPPVATAEAEADRVPSSDDADASTSASHGTDGPTEPTADPHAAPGPEPITEPEPEPEPEPITQTEPEAEPEPDGMGDPSLASTAEAPPTASAPPPDPVPSGALEPSPSAAKRRCRNTPRCLRLTAIGASFGALGLGAVGTGAVLLALPDEPLADDPTKVRSTRPVGTVLVALGAGVVVSSVVMLVAAGRGQQRRGDPAARQARSRVRPLPGGFAF